MGLNIRYLKGQVEFDDHGDRVLKKARLFQYRAGKERCFKFVTDFFQILEGDCVSLVHFAEASLSHNNSYNITLLAHESISTIWPGIVLYNYMLKVFELCILSQILFHSMDLHCQK